MPLRFGNETDLGLPIEHEFPDLRRQGLFQLLRAKGLDDLLLVAAIAEHDTLPNDLERCTVVTEVIGLMLADAKAPCPVLDSLIFEWIEVEHTELAAAALFVLIEHLDDLLSLLPHVTRKLAAEVRFDDQFLFELGKDFLRRRRRREQTLCRRVPTQPQILAQVEDLGGNAEYEQDAEQGGTDIVSTWSGNRPHR